MMVNFRKSATFFLCLISTVVATLHFKPIVSNEIAIENKLNEVIETSIGNSDYYLDLYENKVDYTAPLKCLANMNEEEEKTSFYFVEVAKDLYSKFSKEEKDAFLKLSEENDDPDFQFFYSVFSNNEISTELLENRENDSYLLNEKEKGIQKCALALTLSGFGISSAVASTISGAVVTVGASAWIPFVGWAICAAAIIALTVVIIINWNQICAAFSKIVDFFVSAAAKFAASIYALFQGIKIKILTDRFGDIFNDAKRRSGDTSWSLDEIMNALNESIKSGSTSIGWLDLLMMKDGFNVYLGKYSYDNSSYTFIGNQNGGVYFSMGERLWRNYVKKGKIMWFLNMLFLDIVMIKNCVFKLCTAPNDYYIQSTRQLLDSSFYAKELKHIHEIGWYNWYSNIPIVTANR